MVLDNLILLANRQKSCLDRTCHWAYHGRRQNCVHSEPFPCIFTSVSFCSVSLGFILLNIDFHFSIVNYFVNKMAQRYREGEKLLAPVIDARRDEMKGGTENPVLPFIPLSWKLIFFNRKIS